ncbi:hypothetical protein A2U01_0109862, partial [Trifolium medium]|nr:hypothetical protein [Trifolium medium]
IGRGRVKTAANHMITEERVTVVVKGSSVMDCAISVGRGVICLMTAQGKVISASVADNLGTRPMLVV